MVRKYLGYADESGFLNRPFPDHLRRRISPRKDLREVRVQIILELFAYYGISNRPNKWPLLALALLSGLPTFQHMERSPGRPREIARPDLLYATIAAIEAVARGKPNPVEDPRLRSLVQSIGEEQGIRDLHWRRRRTRIFEMLSLKRGSDWSGVRPSTIKSNYYDQKRLAERVAKDLDKLSQAPPLGARA